MEILKKNFKKNQAYEILEFFLENFAKIIANFNQGKKNFKNKKIHKMNFKKNSTPAYRSPGSTAPTPAAPGAMPVAQCPGRRRRS